MDRWAKAVKPGATGTFAKLPDGIVADLNRRLEMIPEATLADSDNTERGLTSLKSEFENDEGTWNPRDLGDHHTLVAIVRAKWAAAPGTLIAWQCRTLRTHGDGTQPLASRDNAYSDTDMRLEVVDYATSITAAYSAAEHQLHRYVILTGKDQQ